MSNTDRIANARNEHAFKDAKRELSSIASRAEQIALQARTFAAQLDQVDPTNIHRGIDSILADNMLNLMQGIAHDTRMITDSSLRAVRAMSKTVPTEFN